MKRARMGRQEQPRERRRDWDRIGFYIYTSFLGAVRDAVVRLEVCMCVWGISSRAAPVSQSYASVRFSVGEGMYASKTGAGDVKV